ncbi:putative membrane protein [Yarrowia sp. C11]|nr:putative membrane protein [Yarrowia sp. C11]
MATAATTSTQASSSANTNALQPSSYSHDDPEPQDSSFFSSVYSAAQQAANNIMNSAERQDSTDPPTHNNANVVNHSSSPTTSAPSHSATNTPPRSPTGPAAPIETLGQGDLSLAQLGLSRSRANTGSSSKHKSPLAQSSHTSVKHRDQRTPPIALAVASPPGPHHRQGQNELADIEDDRLPVVKRLRSQRLSRGGSSRKRADSSKDLEPTPTTATVASTAAGTPEDITPVTSAAASITGFAYASKKRNEEFHAHFKSVPEDDFLLDDFSCAYSREILVQGRMFVSERHICFFANILGWQTHHVIAFDEIVSLDKKTTAGLFPNGIVVQTLHSTYIYASFISRDATFAFMNTIWKQNSQGVAGSDESDGDSDDGELDSGISDNEADTEPSGAALSAASEAGAAASKWSVPNLGPETHAPTSPGYDPEAKGEKLLCKEIVKAPLGVVANMLFGSENVLGQFLKDNQKCWDVTPIKSCIETKKREYSYIKPLNNSLGPKQTKCQCVDTVEAWDDQGAINVITTTSNHDVPSGNAFTTKTRIIITWAANNQTQVMMSCWFDWTGKSWIKSAIEKGGNDGQMAFAADLIPFLNERCKGSGKPSKGAVAATSAAPKKGHAKHKSHHHHKAEAEHEETTSSSAPPPQTGGALHQFAETWSQIPVLGSLPLPIVGAVLGGIWVLWFVVGMFRGHHTTTHKFDFAGLSDAKKLEIFVMEEEYELWHWIDERVGKSQRTPGRFFVPFEGANPKLVDFSKPKTAAAGGDNAEDMTEADLEEAIRDSEANLQQLRDIKASML